MQKNQQKIKISKGRLIDKGSFGNVYEGINIQTGERYALKQIKIDFHKKKEYLQNIKSKVQQEYNFMKKLSHNKGIVKIHSLIKQQKKFTLVMEYCQTNLQSYMQQQLDHKTIFKLILDLIIILRNMHKNNIIHRDLKPANILIKQQKQNIQVKISDFGVSKYTKQYQIQKMHTNKIGTFLYMAPQVFLNQPYSCKCDSFSLGIIFHQLYFKCFPFEIKDISDINTTYMELKKNKIKLEQNMSIPVQIISIIQKMLQYEQTNRPSMDQIFSLLEPLKIKYNYKGIQLKRPIKILNKKPVLNQSQSKKQIKIKLKKKIS